MTRWFPDGMPQPQADHEAVKFWEAAAKHELTVQRCNACGHKQLPPAPICSECRSDDLGMEQVSGRGEIYTFTILHRPVALEQPIPTIIAVVTLEGGDGVRMITNLVECEPDELEIGQAVEVAWEDMSDDLAIPRFRLVR